MNSVQIDARSSARHRAVRAGTPTTPQPTDLGSFGRWGRFVARRRRSVLIAFIAGLVLAGALGSQMFGALKTAGYVDQGSESAKARTALERTLGVSDPALAIAVEVPGGIDNPAGAAQATAVVARIGSQKGVTSTISYWTSGKPAALRGSDRRTGQVLVYADHLDDAAKSTLARTVAETYGGTRGGLSVYVGGSAAFADSITTHITDDLARAESIAIPITLVLLLLVFGSVVSAGLPFSVAAGSIVGSFAAVWIVTTLTDVSVFALNLITGLGLGLGIDYALLVVNRFREELHAGRSVEDSVARTVATAGRTVAVSGVTVAVVLGALLFFPQYFLRSFGYAGIAVTLLAVVTALTALPALLAVLGRRVDRFTVRRGSLAPTDVGFWSRVARFVMRRPWPVFLGAVLLLLALAVPALSASFGQADARVLPASDRAARANAVLAERFPGQEASPVEVVLPGAAGDPAGVRAYARQLSLLDGVTRVTTPSDVVVKGAFVARQPQATRPPQAAGYVAGRDVRVSVVSDVEPRSSAGEGLVARVRGVVSPALPPAGSALKEARLVGGMAAEYTDSQHAIARRGGWALAWVALATMVVLFLFTGSVVLPLKAVVLNVLSLSATLGVLVWVFQDGHLQWLVGDFTITHSIDTSMAVLVAVVAFALSMDYEVFLLSRIKEEHDAGRSNAEAVALGLQRSGRIVTAAAVLLAVVFASFVTSGVTNIKQLGLGVAFAILLDATLVRGLLVPAFMHLAGDWNWWAPRPLARLHARVGLREG